MVETKIRAESISQTYLHQMDTNSKGLIVLLCLQDVKGICVSFFPWFSASCRVHINPRHLIIS